MVLFNHTNPNVCRRYNMNAPTVSEPVKGIIDYSLLESSEFIEAWKFTRKLYESVRSEPWGVPYCLVSVIWRTAEAEKERRSLPDRMYVDPPYEEE